MSNNERVDKTKRVETTKRVEIDNIKIKNIIKNITIMKKGTFIIIIALLASVLTGCSSEDLTAEVAEMTTSNVKHYTALTTRGAYEDNSLSQVTFTATTENPSIEVKIQSVKICNIKYSGTSTTTVTTRGTSVANWALDALTTNNSFPVAEFGSGSLKSINYNSETTLNDMPFMALPQTVTAWDTQSDANAAGNYQGCLLISCTIYQNSVCVWGKTDANGNLVTENGEVACAEMYVPFGASWQAGKSYSYNIVFGGGYDSNDGKGNLVLTPIKMNASYNAWKTSDSIQD